MSWAEPPAHPVSINPQAQSALDPCHSRLNSELRAPGGTEASAHREARVLRLAFVSSCNGGQWGE